MTSTTTQADQAQSGESMAGQAQQKVQEKAHEVRGQASGRVREQVDTRSTQVGEQMSSVAGAMRQTGEKLRDEGNTAPAKVTDAVAERTERVGSYLRDSDADRILNDVEDYARRHPWVLAVGGLAVGLVASRFLKASSGGRYEAQKRAYGGAYASPRQPEPEITFEPDVELGPVAGGPHGT